MTYKIGDFVRYKIKNELGLVGEVTNHGIRVWYHLGGTRSLSPEHIIEPLTREEVLEGVFSNEYAKASLMERQMRLIEGGDTSDLIDRDDIRQQIFKLLEDYIE